MGKEDYKSLQGDIRKIELPGIGTWDNEYSDKQYNVFFETEEFTCVCPKTGLPDFARLEIDYSPDAKCIELKSFKEYLLAYRDLGIFHEHVVNRLLEDLVRTCSPRYMKVRGIFGVRGGIKTTVEAEYDPRKETGTSR